MLGEILCSHEERTVGRDNTISYQRRTLQLPESRVRPHYVKARVTLKRYPDGALAIFHGPRLLARYTAEGDLLNKPPTRLAA
jgi:hypothetical protein